VTKAAAYHLFVRSGVEVILSIQNSGRRWPWAIATIQIVSARVTYAM
jgi:hypothetical protein